MANDYTNKHLLIFGTGAVGGYYGGMLARAGFNVTFVARGKNYEILKEKGLTLIRDGKKENFPITVVETQLISTLQKIFDYILICVKSKDTKSAAESIKPIIGKNTTIVSFQNGIENEEILAHILGKDKVIGGLVFVASNLIEPGVVYQFGYNGGLIGELNCKKTERVAILAQMFKESGIDMNISDNIIGDLWNKLVWNAAFNPLSVITGKTVDKILEEDHKLVKNIMSEVRDVAFAFGINLRPDTVEFNLNRSKGFIGFKTSMLQDFEKGRPLEIEEILGVVIRKAKEKKVPVPNTEMVYEKVRCASLN